jgi:hypothetical protein
MIGDGDCGEIGGMKIGKGNRSTRRKPAPAPLCPPQIPHELPRFEPGRRGGKPATNRLSYGAALSMYYIGIVPDPPVHIPDHEEYLGIPTFPGLKKKENSISLELLYTFVPLSIVLLS